MREQGITIGNVIGRGGFGVVYEVANTNLVAKAIEYAPRDMTNMGSEEIKKFKEQQKIRTREEIETMKKIGESLAFSLPLCGWKNIKENGFNEGAVLLLPRAKGDLGDLCSSNTKISKNELKNFRWCYLCGLNKEGRNIISQINKHFNKKLPIIRQMASGLEEFHLKTGLVHRDIKPKNYLILEEPKKESRFSNLSKNQDRIVLADFGLTKENPYITTGTVGGTYKYMPYFDFTEELVHGNELTIDQKFDVYSLGITILELLNGDIMKPFLDRIYDEITQNGILTFEIYETWKDDLTKNITKRYEMPEKQKQLEQYIIDNILVLHEQRVTSTELVEFLNKIDDKIFLDVTDNYGNKTIKCADFSKPNVPKPNSIMRNDYLSYNRGSNGINKVHPKLKSQIKMIKKNKPKRLGEIREEQEKHKMDNPFSSHKRNIFELQPFEGKHERSDIMLIRNNKVADNKQRNKRRTISYKVMQEIKEDPARMRKKYSASSEDRI